VATLVADRAYERAWPDLDMDRVLKKVDLRDWQAVVETEFAWLDPTGRAAAEIWRELRQKLTRWQAAIETRRAFVEASRRSDVDAYLGAHVRPVAEVADALARAAAPLRFGDLSDPIAANRARSAIAHSHLIRARFTLGDLLSHAGWLNGETASLLLGEATDQDTIG
jgi:hypothetical protein